MNPNTGGGPLPPTSTSINPRNATSLKLKVYHSLVTKEKRAYGDKRIQSECRKDFELFSQEIKRLGPIFEAFMRAIRPIGSSSRLIRASVDLQRRMNDVLDLFRSNSAEIWKEFSGGIGSDQPPNELQGSLGPDAPSALKLLPCTMYHLSDGLDKFLESLCDIPEFMDQRLTDSLREFRDWIIYRAGRVLTHRESDLVSETTIRHYICEVMKEMTDHISLTYDVLSDFIGDGVNAIRGSQEQAQNRLQNMSTVATFLSAVTATTIQYAMDRAKLRTVVMALWVSSLILSIASAINSQLVMHWRAAMYRSPRSALPVLMSVCLDHTPLLCLVAAVLAFSTGLVIWTIAADLALAVKICAGVFTGSTFIVLLAVIAWDIREWWEENSTKKSEKAPVEAERAPGLQELHDRWQKWKNDKAAAAEKPKGKSIGTLASQSPTEPTIGNNSTALRRFQTAAQQVIFYNRLRKLVDPQLGPQPEHHNSRPDEFHSLQPAYHLPMFHPFGYDISFSPDGAHLAVGELKGNVVIWKVDIGRFHETQRIPVKPRIARVRFAWSPDSSRLAMAVENKLVIRDTTSWSIQAPPQLTDQQPTLIAWLQSSRHVIAVIQDTLYVYNAELVTKTPFHPPVPVTVHDVASIPPAPSDNSLGFVLVLGTGQDKPTDSLRTRRPSTASAEHWLIIMNLDTQGKSVAQAPTLADARNICVSRDGRFALISYGDGNCPELWRLRDLKGNMELLFRGRFAPHGPEAREGNTEDARFVKACFCGKMDEWVMATDGSSNIYIWDRATRYLLHTLRGADIKNKFKHYSSINSITSTLDVGAGTGMIVVSTCERGGVIIWKYCNQQEGQAEEDSASEGGSPGTGVATSESP